MPSLEVAHLREQGQNMIVVPVDSDFGYKSPTHQKEIIGEIQMRSRAAGLAGTIAVVWDAGGGAMGFIAPRPWHPFFQSISLHDIAMNLNKVLSW